MYVMYLHNYVCNMYVCVCLYTCMYMYVRMYVHVYMYVICIIPGVHEPRWRQGRSVQLLYTVHVKHCVDLCPTNCTRSPYMGKQCQTLSKQSGGAKWLTIHKNLPTNRTQCTCSTTIVYTNELWKRKAAVVSLHPMKRTRSTSLASLPQETTKNMGSI